MAAVHIEANNPELQATVKLAFTITAIAAVNEDDTYPNHVERLVMAGKVLHGIADPYDLTMGVLTNTTVQTTILAGNTPSFNDIQFSVTEIYDAFALTA